MIKLCVNIDHVATVRQARMTVEPDPVLASDEAVLGGADGITLHIREDRRHMQDSDLYALKKHVEVPLNLELAATPEMLALACKTKPLVRKTSDTVDRARWLFKKISAQFFAINALGKADDQHPPSFATSLCWGRNVWYASTPCCLTVRGKNIRREHSLSQRRL